MRTRAGGCQAAIGGLFFVGLAAAGLLVFVMLPLVFAWPRGEADTRSEPLALGSVSDYPIGSITLVAEGELHLVRVSEEVFLALSWREPGRGCTIPWRPEFAWLDSTTGDVVLGWFRDPCRGSTFDREGHRVFGPAPRDMDRYVVTIVNDEITVDAGTYVCGFSPPAEPCEAAAP